MFLMHIELLDAEYNWLPSIFTGSEHKPAASLFYFLWEILQPKSECSPCSIRRISEAHSSLFHFLALQTNGIM